MTKAENTLNLGALPLSSRGVGPSLPRGAATRAVYCCAFLGWVAVGCGGDAGFGESGGETSQVREPERGTASEGSKSPTVADTDGETNAPFDGLIPGYQPVAYPEGPYGVLAGSRIANLSWLGLRDPVEAGFDMKRAEPISLSDFYNPDGDGNVELILFNAVALWCSACQLEYREIDSTGLYEEYGPRGLEIVGVLFEDLDSREPKYEDMTTWTEAFNVDFPFVMDPGFTTGAYFDKSATPMNMVIDARTMEILVSYTGYSADIFDKIDRELSARGR